MNPIATHLAKEVKRKKTYSRILTNKMTIAGWLLFKGDRRIHFGFVLLRLRKDFGFTDWELANFTGMPVSHIHNFLNTVLPIVDSKILKILGDLDEKKLLKEWNELRDGVRGQQGYYVVKDKKEWYDIKNEEKGKFKEPDVKLGRELEKEYEDKISG